MLDYDIQKTNSSKNNYKVFSCFACGGGSSMGYKLADYSVIGFNEIDKKMSDLYESNFNVNYKFKCDIRELCNIAIPDELYNLDVLDGSPPCTTFSMAGLREKTWGKEKKFAEGQTKQTLDDLSFHFLNFAKRIQPKIIVMENVSGLMIGLAQKYVNKIYNMLSEIGYQAQHYIMHSEFIGVPQERTRFILLGLRNDLCSINSHKVNMFSELPIIDMRFEHKPIILNDILCDTKQLTGKQHYSDKRFGDIICDLGRPMPTITTINRYFLNKETLVGDETLRRASTFPKNYNFNNNKIQYVVGMSVPPIMMKNIADRIKEHWLSRIYVV